MRSAHRRTWHACLLLLLALGTLLGPQSKFLEERRSLVPVLEGGLTTSNSAILVARAHETHLPLKAFPQMQTLNPSAGSCSPFICRPGWWLLAPSWGVRRCSGPNWKNLPGSQHP